MSATVHYTLTYATTLIILAATSVTCLSQGVVGETIRCGYYQCSTATHYCDDVQGDCVHCIGICSRPQQQYREHCQKWCPIYYRKQQEKMKPISTSSTVKPPTVIVPDTDEVVMEKVPEDPNDTTEQQNQIVFYVLLAFIGLLVVSILLLVLYILRLRGYIKVRLSSRSSVQ